MLRKSSTVGLIFVLSCILFTPVQAAAPNTIPEFLDEYYEAIKNNDVTLSHNLLRYNEERLENYMKENHSDRIEQFHEIKKSALGNKADIDSVLYGHLELVLWLDALVHPEPRFFKKEKIELVNSIERYHNRIEPDTPVDLADIRQFWDSVLPAASLTYDDGFFQLFSRHYELLAQAENPEEVARILSLSLEMMQASEDEGGIRLDALLWTIIIVGGCILMTLSYVGYRKYQAEKKEKTSRLQRRKPNS
ncbi:sporulation protein YpjB [Thalassobacillus devorans]|uniref:sporulation protein YpjB n=1 Tax=Thalassobacillus devorans TaxID=279813 RepID=UPI00048ED305|nr:sporulation protein YpjB [Thalassobacillus devorans]